MLRFHLLVFVGRACTAFLIQMKIAIRIMMQEWNLTFLPGCELVSEWAVAKITTSTTNCVSHIFSTTCVTNFIIDYACHTIDILSPIYIHSHYCIRSTKYKQ